MIFWGFPRNSLKNLTLKDCWFLLLYSPRRLPSSITHDATKNFVFLTWWMEVTTSFLILGSLQVLETFKIPSLMSKTINVARKKGIYIVTLGYKWCGCHLFTSSWVKTYALDFFLQNYFSTIYILVSTTTMAKYVNIKTFQIVANTSTLVYIWALSQYINLCIFWSNGQ